MQMLSLLHHMDKNRFSPSAGAEIFPVRALQALADVNVAKNWHAGSCCAATESAL